MVVDNNKTDGCCAGEQELRLTLGAPVLILNSFDVSPVNTCSMYPAFAYGFLLAAYPGVVCRIRFLVKTMTNKAEISIIFCCNFS